MKAMWKPAQPRPVRARADDTSNSERSFAIRPRPYGSRLVFVASVVTFGIGTLLFAQNTKMTPAAPSTAADATKYRAMLDKYCVGCHNSKAGLPADNPVKLDT